MNATKYIGIQQVEAIKTTTSTAVQTVLAVGSTREYSSRQDQKRTAQQHGQFPIQLFFEITRKSFLK